LPPYSRAFDAVVKPAAFPAFLDNSVKEDIIQRTESHQRVNYPWPRLHAAKNPGNQIKVSAGKAMPTDALTLNKKSVKLLCNSHPLSGQ